MLLRGGGGQGRGQWSHIEDRNAHMEILLYCPEELKDLCNTGRGVATQVS